MAKIYGLFGSMQGKVADVVMAVRNGEQIVRKYQPVVSNPKSEAQVAARAKLKLMSQLSAVMAPVIAIPKKGAVSSRNMFVKTNYPAATFSDNQADVTLNQIKLTRSVVAMPSLITSREGTQLTVRLAGSTSLDVNRIVYCVFFKQENNELRYGGSQVATEAGESNVFQTTIQLGNAADTLVIYAYGVRDNTEAARVIFGNMQALTAESVAKVIVTRTLLETDVTLTDTSATTSAPSV